MVVVSDQETPSDATEQGGAWARPVPALVGEVAVAAALLAAAIFFTWQSALLPFGSVGLPGPGFLPFALGIALGLVALAMFLRAVHAVGDGKNSYFGHRDVLVVFVALVGVAFAFERVDTYLTLGAFALTLLLLVARAAPWRAVLGASLGMVAVWAVFRISLGVRLPTGEFWGVIQALLAAKFNAGH